jgi:Zn finger protein HypA/HybF involved in hydrogenase expression
MTGSDDLLNPDMPSEQIKLHMGEMSAQDIRNVRAAIRWANKKAAARIRALEAEFPKTPRRCPCGRGRVSAYDGKCGHCRTNRERAIHYKMINQPKEPSK